MSVHVLRCVHVHMYICDSIICMSNYIHTKKKEPTADEERERERALASAAN